MKKRLYYCEKLYSGAAKKEKEYIYHLPMNGFGFGLITFCGIKKRTYALNFGENPQVQCKICLNRYKYLWWIYPITCWLGTKRFIYYNLKDYLMFWRK